MKRVIMMHGLMLLALTGCTPTPPPAPPLQGTPSRGPLHYAAWAEMTKQPIRVDAATFARCALPPGAKERGPHFVPAVRVYANDLAEKHFRDKREGPLPAGAMVVKEKWQNEKDANPSAYAAMIKREAGFDADNGDWEYLYVTLGEKDEVERGPIKSCIDCHKGAAKTDYLFRPYLKAE